MKNFFNYNQVFIIAALLINIVAFCDTDIATSDPSNEFLLNGGIENQPFFLQDVEPIYYSGQFQSYDAAAAKKLRVTVTTDNETTVLKETDPTDAGFFELQLSEYSFGYHLLKHEILDESEKVLASMQKGFTRIDLDEIEVHVGELSKNETWSTNKVHIIYNSFVIPSGRTLRIASGAIVKFCTGASIDISSGASCIVNGTIFTHINDDAVGGDTLNDGLNSIPMDAYSVNGDFTYNDDTVFRYLSEQQEELTGTISKNTKLKKNKTYTVSGTLSISGCTLEIPPGTVLKMKTGASISVNSGATLNAIGTRIAPIIITSIKDDTYSGDTNNDGNMTIPQPGDWNMIGCYDGKIKMEYTSVLYGGSSMDVLALMGGSISFNNSTLAHAKQYAVDLESGDFSMINSIFADFYTAFRHWSTSFSCVNSVFYDMTYLSNNGGQNFINCIIANYAKDLCWWGDTCTYKNCVIWNPAGFGPQSSDKTRTNGNIWGDPLFLDAENGDFRISEYSPCVDAGDSNAAPEFDYYGHNRATIRLGHVGNKPAADIGIFEVLSDDLKADIDLVPISVTSETNAVPGGTISVEWEVKNDGIIATRESWRDTISLVSEYGNEVKLGDSITTAKIEGKATLSCSYVFKIPAISEGTWYPKVNINSYHDVFEGYLSTNNTFVSRQAINVALKGIDPNVPGNGVINAGTPTIVKLVFSETNENRMVTFTLPKGVIVTWGFGFVPEGKNYRTDASGSVVSSGDGVMFRVPDDVTEVYVVLESDDETTYNFSTESTKMTITGVTPKTLPSIGTTTLTISGAGFGETNIVVLTSAINSYKTKPIGEDQSGNLLVLIDCEALEAGQTYSVRVESEDGTAELSNAISVVNASTFGKIEKRLDIPGSARQGRIAIGYIEYTNVGSFDAAAPIFILRSKTGGVTFFNDSTGQFVETLKLVGLGSSYPKGILRAGEKCRLPFKFKVMNSYDVSLSMLDSDSFLSRDSVFATWKEFSEAISAAATRMNGLTGVMCDYDRISDNAMQNAYGQDSECIAGTLINVLTDNPMQGQTLQLIDSEGALHAETTTDTDGSFRFDNLPHNAKFRISATTCQANMPEILTSTLDALSLTIYAADFATVECSVDGGAEAVVLIDLSDEKIHRMESDKGNVWKIDGISDGEYLIEALFGDFRCVTNNVIVGVDLGQVTNKTLRLTPIVGGRINLAVVDEAGKYLSNISGSVYCTNNNFSAKFTSNEQGKIIATLPAGDYAISISGGYSLVGDEYFAINKEGTANVTAVVERSPIVVFPSCGPCPLTTEFALSETNGMAQIVSCRWDFDSDGSWDKQGLCVTNKYTDVGEYSAKCLVEFADGTKKEFKVRDKIEVWEYTGYEPADGALVINEKSGYEIIARDDTSITLSMTGRTWPIFIQEGDILIDPANLDKPRKVLEILAVDQFTLKISTEFISMENAYNSAFLVFVKNETREDFVEPDLEDYLNLDDEGKGIIPIKGAIDLERDIKKDTRHGFLSASVDGCLTHDWVIKIQKGEVKRLESRMGFGGKISVEGELGSKLWEKDRLKGDHKKRELFRLSRSRGNPKKKTIVDLAFPVGVIPARLVGRILAEAGIGMEISANVSCETTIVFDGRDWTTHFQKSFNIDNPELNAEAYVKIGVELEFAIGAGKDVNGKQYCVHAADIELEVGGKISFEVTLRDETMPDEYDFWGGIYLDGNIDVAHVIVGKWLDVALIRFDFGEHDWKLYSLDFKTPIPNFAVSKKQLSEEAIAAEFTSTTEAAGEVLSERNWRCGEVDLGSSRTVNYTFSCKPDDWVSYEVILRERYKWVSGWAQDLTRSKIRHKTLKLRTKKDGEPECEIEDHGGFMPYSCDPNEMSGPLGVGDPETERIVKPGEWLTYTVYFENTSNATAAAQEVYVTNPLNKYLDWSTFEMGDIAFNNQIDLGLAGMQSGTSEVTANGTNYNVRTQLELDKEKGEVKWYMRIVDLSTETGWPDDILIGFLPPNDETYRGEGHLTYRIKLREDAPAGVRIDNSATIVFDYNDPIETDPAWWNTVAKMQMVRFEGGLTNLNLVVGMPYGELPVLDDRDGWLFIGWFTEPDGAGKHITSESLVEEGDDVLYAYWTANAYTVNYNANGGEGEMESQNIAYDMVFNLSSNRFTRRYYKFGGWATNETGSIIYSDGATVSNLTTVAGGVVNLYAVWQNYSTKVKINIDGTETNLNLVVGSPYGELPVPAERTGWTFVGWFTEPDGSGRCIAADSIVEEEDGNLYAYWTANAYTVNYNANGGEGEMESQDAVYGMEFSLSSNTFTRTYYEFTGWATNETSSVVYSDGETVSNLTAVAGGEVDLYACWTQNTYTVNYNSNGGEGEMESQTVAYGMVFNLSSNTFTRTNYKYTGWATNETSSVVYSDGETVSNLTAVAGGVVDLYAVWKSLAVQIKIDFGGSETNLNLYVGSPYGELPIPAERIGWTFIGWFTEPDGGGRQITKDTIVQEDDGALYAYWTQNAYTVNYNSNGGEGEMESQTVAYGMVFDLSLNMFTRTNYKHTGWATNETGSVVYSDGETVSNLTVVAGGEVDLYAVWESLAIQIKINIDGSETNLNLYVGSPYGVLPVPAERKGWVFVGWFTGPDGTGRLVTAETLVEEGDETLYQYWVRKTHNLVEEDEENAVISIYDGYIFDPNDHNIAGCLQAKIGNSKNGKCKVTVTITMAGGVKTDAKAEMDMSVGKLEAFAKNGKSLKLTFGANDLSGTFDNYEVDGARNIFTSKNAADQANANAVLGAWKGAYTVAWESGIGYSVISASIGAKGKAKATGFLSNGTKFSATGQFIVGEKENCVVLVSKNQSVPLAFNLWLISGESLEAEGLDESYVIAKAGQLNDGAFFECEYLTEKVPVSVQGKKWLTSTNKETALKLVFKDKTGMFKGSFNVGTQKASVNGVVIEGIGYGSAVIKGSGSKSVLIK